jgi:hypothetical protein
MRSLPALEYRHRTHAHFQATASGCVPGGRARSLHDDQALPPDVRPAYSLSVPKSASITSRAKSAKAIRM